MKTEIVPSFFRLGYGIKRILDENTEKISSYRKSYSDSNGGKLTNQQVIVMLFLYLHPNSTVTSIAENMNKEPPNIVNQLNHLEDLNLVERTREKSDRRKVYVQLTIKGKEFVQDKPDSFSDKVSRRLNNLDANKKTEVLEAMEVMQSTLAEVLPELFDAVDHYHQA